MMKKLCLISVLLLSVLGSVNVNAEGDKTCAMSPEQEHKALYNKYKLPDMPSIFQNCGFGNLFNFNSIINGVFDKVRNGITNKLKGSFCGFTVRDAWGTYGGTKWPGDTANAVQNEVQGELKKSIDKIQFPIFKKSSNSLYNVVFN